RDATVTGVQTCALPIFNAAAENGAREVLVAGGVAANSVLRAQLAERLTMPFRYPPLSLCTDNAAMIAAAAYYRYTDSRQYDLAKIGRASCRERVWTS